MTQHIEFSVGFMISDQRSLVALIQKQKPTWQRGKLNGIGGAIEQGETPLQAMRREFLEETGYAQEDWNILCTLRGKQIRFGNTNATFAVHFFACFVAPAILQKLRTVETENIVVVPIANVDTNNALPNLPWLLRMALDIERDVATHFVIEEKYE